MRILCYDMVRYEDERTTTRNVYEQCTVLPLGGSGFHADLAVFAPFVPLLLA